MKLPAGPPPWATASLEATSNQGNSLGLGHGHHHSSSIRLLDKWDIDSKFRDQVVNELIKDCIHSEVAGMVSGTLAVSSTLFAFEVIALSFALRVL